MISEKSVFRDSKRINSRKKLLENNGNGLLNQLATEQLFRNYVTAE